MRGETGVDLTLCPRGDTCGETSVEVVEDFGLPAVVGLFKLAVLPDKEGGGSWRLKTDFRGEIKAGLFSSIMRGDFGGEVGFGFGLGLELVLGLGLALGSS